MSYRASLTLGLCALAFCLPAGAHDSFSQDETAMIQDHAGWEYISITDPDAGVQTTHTCFDGQPHPGVCSGNVTLHTDGKFVKKIFVHGKADTRSGTYKIDGHQITFTDEVGATDGPYSLDLNMKAKTLHLQIAGADMMLMLESEYRKQGGQSKQ